MAGASARHYLILDEAHYIKNFKSQRWQTLLTFATRRRLLLTGTPLQNSLMELWSLMHFLMPHLFRSQNEFKQWFSTPLIAHVEGASALDTGLVKRLHTVLRPFILRRLKTEVAKQLPQKYEHVVRCRLSNRQRSVRPRCVCVCVLWDWWSCVVHAYERCCHAVWW